MPDTLPIRSDTEMPLTDFVRGTGIVRRPASKMVCRMSTAAGTAPWRDFTESRFDSGKTGRKRSRDLAQINPASGEDGSAYSFFGIRPAR